ncbi:MAG TPA: metal-sensing transcriptional repressor [Candidatus Ornithospirochaeta avicola]|uniref:Copper-sensing transcriptional repressor CsoR n=1 Tax=Candidatus Ornithospirochaeta avicola TaxID=2840896 RepID=A0A9D1TMT4_9SPIO|nr:metal-sensing transcriptional repressor [Candidatus Ornithospirochaeta avicola]
MKADKKSISRKLNIARGQLAGINDMISKDRYCIDISAQIMATIAILKKVNQEILESHINSCVRQALENREDAEEKITEAISALEKMGRL